MNEQLNPCPFCGHPPIEWAPTGLIKCLYSGCSSNPESYSLHGWNTRADWWVSAKVSPPKKSCQVIAEWSNGDVEQSSYITDLGKPHFQRKCGTDENGTGWVGNVGYVVNWMPLPKAASCGE